MHYLHIITNEKFTESYIEFINKYFDSTQHLFLVIESEEKFKINSRNNVKEINTGLKSIVEILKGIYLSDKVFLHNLFTIKVVCILFLQPWLLKKCNWLIWGSDLYRYMSKRRTLRYKLYEFIRKVVIRNMDGLITHIKGDFELAQKWYGAKGKYYYCFMYPSNLYKNYIMKSIKSVDDKIVIQIGNSANPTNNHLEVLEKLEKYKHYNIEILCPLSYGNANYREKIILRGKELFGDKFTPLIDFMPFNDYLELLAKVDIAIFNHNRQQAMGNITTLLGLGKKVYVRSDITTWEFFIDHGLKVFSINEDLDGLLEKMSENVKNNNIERVKQEFSENKLVSDWKSIFASKGLPLERRKI